MNTAIIDPDFNSYQVMLTSGTWGNSIGFGSVPTQTFNEQAGEWDPFSQDNSLLLVANNQGDYALMALDVALIHAKGCAPQQPSPAPNTTCAVWAGISTGSASGDGCTQGAYGTGCTLLNGNGEFSFSRSARQARVIYELMGNGSGALVQVNQLLVSCPSGAPGTWGTNTCSFTRTPYVNFTSDYADPAHSTYPTKCSVVASGFTSNSPWMGAFSVANDGTVGYAAGGAGDRQAETAYGNNNQVDAFIYPLTNNAGKNAYQATTPGTTGTTEPNWGASTAGCPAAGNTCADGTVTWTNIGKIGGQGPGFDLVYYSPSLGCRRFNSLTGYIYNGNHYTGPAGPGQMQTDSVPALFNSCLNQFDSCTGNVCKPPSGSYANYTTTGSPGGMCPSCTQGQIGYCQNVAEAGIAPLTDEGTLHDGGIRANSRYFTWTPSGTSFVAQTESCRNSGNAYQEEVCYNYAWDVTTNIARPEHTWVNWNGADVNGQSDGHEISGYTGNWKGGFSQFHNYSEPNFPNAADFGSSLNCYSVSGSQLSDSPCSIGSVFSGAPLLVQQRNTAVTGAPWDEHGANRVSNSTDTVPVLLFNTAVPAMGRAGGGYPGSLPGYNEITGMATQPVAGCSSTIATYCQYRFAHNWGTGSVTQFNGQNEQGMNSQDGTFAAVASDVMGSRGSVSPDWSATHAFAYGADINPVCASGCTNAMHSSFAQMNAAGCTSGGTVPTTWPTVPGQTVSDGSGPTACSWQNISQPATGSTAQLACNGLRADLLQTTGATIYLGTRIFDLSTGNIYQATGCSAASTCSAANGGAGLTATQSVAEGTLSLSNTPAYMSTLADSNGIVWEFIGQNDCRTDVILVDLQSARGR